MALWTDLTRSTASRRRRIITLSAGVLLLGTAAPELGILPWTPVRGDTKQSVESGKRNPVRFAPVRSASADTAASFATPWIVPDPPPIATAVKADSEAPARISIRASNVSWVTVCADGRKVMERLFEAGSAAEIPFANQATVRSGNAGALEIGVTGHSMGPMGPWGAIRMIKATPEGYQFVAPVITSGCDAG